MNEERSVIEATNKTVNSWEDEETIEISSLSI
jgi:hypothetical protein